MSQFKNKIRLSLCFFKTISPSKLSKDPRSIFLGDLMNPIPLMSYSDRFTWAKYGHFILFSGLIPVNSKSFAQIPWHWCVDFPIFVVPFNRESNVFCCCANYYLLGCFYIARHLAAEFGTRLAAFSVYVLFAMGGWFTSWSDAAFLVIFCNMLFSSDSDD